MYTHLITFITVILAFELYTPSPEAMDDLVWGEVLSGTAGTLLVFYILVRLGFSRWRKRIDQKALDPRATPLLHTSLLQRYLFFAVLIYALFLYVFRWKVFCVVALGTESAQFAQSLLGIFPFLMLLVTAWAGSYPHLARELGPGKSIFGFLASQAKLHFIILVPWLGILLVWDLFSLLSIDVVLRIQEDVLWSLGAFLIFILLLAWLFPVFVVRLWRCPPLPDGPVRQRLEGFLARHKFRYAGIVLWTLFEGSFSTAGILGFIARTRYVLLTPSLIQKLSAEELEAVMAHEMGHAKHRHMLFYLIFIVGLTLVFNFGLQVVTLLLSLGPLAIETRGISIDAWLAQPDTASTVISILITVPCLVLVILYLRYVFGLFSRNFERQSDLQALEIQKTASHIVRSLDKISGYSPLVRVLPSWHHFSIQERIHFLKACERYPSLIKQHHRKVRMLVGAYLMAMIALAGILIGWSPQEWERDWRFALLQQIAERRLKEAPEDAAIWFALGTIAFERDEFSTAEEAYRKVIHLNPQNAEALNNLAWLYATAAEDGFRKPKEALRLAEEAARLAPDAPHILDTLAEAYFINDMPTEALEMEQKALALATEQRDYYIRQAERFRRALK
jgi:Zn-dependent protease with chaperone function